MNIKNVTELGLKELFSLRSDPVLIFLIIYIFSIAVYAVANGVDYDVNNAAVAVVDEDRSALSRNISAALLPPQFKTPVETVRGLHSREGCFQKGREGRMLSGKSRVGRFT